MNSVGESPTGLSAEDPRCQAAGQVAWLWIRRGHGGAREVQAAARTLGIDSLVIRAWDAKSWVPPDGDEATSLGTLYEALVANHQAERRRVGMHYTPAPLCDEVTQATMRGIAEATGGLPTVVDPAVGTGAFLLSANRVLMSGRSRARRTAFTRDHLYGVDIDPFAVLVARLALAIGTDLSPSQISGVVAGDAVIGSLNQEPWATLMARARGGFDLVLSNPPYVGGKRIRTHFGDAYARRLSACYQPISRNVDFAAHFLRRGYALLNRGGALGFVTTNTIAQGATREAGLSFLIDQGAALFEARSRVPWPGVAAVIATTIHLAKPLSERTTIARRLDGQGVPNISSYLTASDHRPAARRLTHRPKLAFIGCFVRGMGFTFDDSSQAASPLAQMNQLLQQFPTYGEAILPYLGGAEVNQHPEQMHHRHVIFLGDLTLAEARQRFPYLVEILERKVRPGRQGLRETKADLVHARAWWRFANDRPELRRAIAALDHVIVVPRVSPHVVAARLPTGAIFSDQLVVFASNSFGLWGLLQSQLHATWAWRFSSTLGDGLRYTPRTAFETLVRPDNLDGVAKISLELEPMRRAFLVEQQIGLTAFYNRFHDASERGLIYRKFRRMHAELEIAVAQAYGIEPPTEFGFYQAEFEPNRRLRFGAPPCYARALVNRLFDLNGQACEAT